MIKERLAEMLSQAWSQTEVGISSSLYSDASVLPIIIEQPKNKSHGDFSSPLALQLSARNHDQTGALPLATMLVSELQRQYGDSGDFISTWACPPGFVNFKVGPALVGRLLVGIAADTVKYGSLRWSDNCDGHAILTLQSALDRCHAILRAASGQRLNILSGASLEPLFNQSQWLSFIGQCREQVDVYSGLFDEEESLPIDLILLLDSFYKELDRSIAAHDRGRLILFGSSLAQSLDNFYRRSNHGFGFFHTHLSVLKARLGLIFVGSRVLSNVLGIIGLSTVEQL